MFFQNYPLFLTSQILNNFYHFQSIQCILADFDFFFSFLKVLLATEDFPDSTEESDLLDSELSRFDFVFSVFLSNSLNNTSFPILKLKVFARFVSRIFRPSLVTKVMCFLLSVHCTFQPYCCMLSMNDCLSVAFSIESMAAQPQSTRYDGFSAFSDPKFCAFLVFFITFSNPVTPYVSRLLAHFRC